jgi:Aminotransferase class-V
MLAVHERDRAPFSALDLADYRDQNTVLDGLAPFINWTANLTGSGNAERLEGVRVDPAFFDLLGVRPTFGRTIARQDGRTQVAVFTHRLWRRRFGADLESLGTVPSLRLLGPTQSTDRVPVFTFVLGDLPATSVAEQLDRRGIAVRAGDMAALPLLKRFGASEAVRGSAYLYSTPDDLDRLANALRQIVRL